MGVGKDGEPTDELPARHGAARASTRSSPKAARGHLGRQLIAHVQAATRARDPQVYGIGLKELWEIEPEQARARARDAHRRLAARRPTPTAARSSITWTTTRSRSASSSASTTRTRTCSPFEEFQRWKTHPAIRDVPRRRQAHLATARARSPRAACSRCRRLVFPGGALVGCDAGFLNATRIKGSHAAIKSGMLAAEAAFEALARRPPARRARRLSRSVREELAARRAAQGAQLQAVVQEGPVRSAR